VVSQDVEVAHGGRLRPRARLPKLRHDGGLPFLRADGGELRSHLLRPQLRQVGHALRARRADQERSGAVDVRDRRDLQRVVGVPRPRPQARQSQAGLHLRRHALSAPREPQENRRMAGVLEVRAEGRLRDGELPRASSLQRARLRPSLQGGQAARRGALGDGRRVQGHARKLCDDLVSDALPRGDPAHRQGQQRVCAPLVLRLKGRSVHAKLRQRALLRRELVVSVEHETVSPRSLPGHAPFAHHQAPRSQARHRRSDGEDLRLLPASGTVPRRRQPHPVSHGAVARSVHGRGPEPARIGGPPDRQDPFGRLVRRLQSLGRLCRRSLRTQSNGQGLQEGGVQAAFEQLVFMENSPNERRSTRF